MPVRSAHARNWNDNTNEDINHSFDHSFANVLCLPGKNPRIFSKYKAHCSGQSHSLIPQPRSDFQSH